MGAHGAHGIPWDPMGSRGIPWDPMGSMGSQGWPFGPWTPGPMRPPTRHNFCNPMLGGQFW